MKLEDAIKKIFSDIREDRFSTKVGQDKHPDQKRRDAFEKQKNQKALPKSSKQKPGFSKPVKEAQLDENQSSDPVVDDTSGAIVSALIMALEENIIGDNAFEMMMGSAPDENRLTQVRLEDVEASAELVVQAVYRDPALHDSLKQLAMEMIESAAEAIQD